MGIIFYQVLKIMSINELNLEMKEMEEPVRRNYQFFVKYGISDLPGIDSMMINKIETPPGSFNEFRDTLLFDTNTKQYRSFHIYSFFIVNRDDIYQIDLIKSTTPTDTLVERVTLMMTFMVMLFLAGIFFLNRFIFANLWKDFFTALDKLRKFNAEKGAIMATDSDVQEFNELNMVLEDITDRLSIDYQNLKEYTDHTTHELLTPLANIKSKVELLFQSENLQKAELEYISDISKNSDHLSRLNSTLALITRIENQQYKKTSNINLASLIDRQLDMLKELVELRKIHIRKKVLIPDIIVNMDQGLADILVINLLKNAISHNDDEGIIEIELSDRQLIFRNSGPEIQCEPEKLFDRFYRDSKKPDSFGLGLSLVKKICESYGFTIEYEYEHDLHSFTLTFLP
jgi:signal transduction histidine kinase